MHFTHPKADLNGQKFLYAFLSRSMFLDPWVRHAFLSFYLIEAAEEWQDHCGKDWSSIHGALMCPKKAVLANTFYALRLDICADHENWFYPVCFTAALNLYCHWLQPCFWLCTVVVKWASKNPSTYCRSVRRKGQVMVIDPTVCLTIRHYCI